MWAPAEVKHSQNPSGTVITAWVWSPEHTQCAMGKATGGWHITHMYSVWEDFQGIKEHAGRGDNSVYLFHVLEASVSLRG